LKYLIILILSRERISQNTVEVRIMQFSPYSSPIALVFGRSFIQRFRRVSSERGRQTREGWGKQVISQFYASISRKRC